MVDISIVIRTKNEGKSLPLTLEKIYAQKIDKTFEVIIVDSGSTDDTLKIAEKFGCRILRIPPEKFTYPFALNFGTANAKGRLIVYLSAHCQPVNGYWLYHLTKHFSNSKVAGVFGREIPIKSMNPVYEYYQLHILFPSNTQPISNLFSNTNSCVRKDVWEKYHFDESKFKRPYLIGEDQLWALVIKNQGYKIIYEPKAIVYHSHKFSMKWLKRLYSGGYFYKELQFVSPILKEKRFSKLFSKYIKTKISVLTYLLKNHYIKQIFWDFPLTIFFEVLWFYIGKRDRKKDDKLKKSLKNYPQNSKHLSN